MRAKLAALAAALRKLPENETAVIVLTYYDRMTDAQIAERMRLTPERVAALRQRAEETLCNLLKGHYKQVGGDRHVLDHRNLSRGRLCAACDARER